MPESWKTIHLFEDYSVSDHGNVRSDKSGRNLALNENQFGLLQVGLMRNGVQYHRSVTLLVARAFLEPVGGPFDTPINLDGNRHNNHVENLSWRPRWFAIKFNRQFRYSDEYFIDSPIVDQKTGEISDNSLECAKKYGLLQYDIYLAIMNRTYVWPTYQEFGIVGEQMTLDIE